MGWFIRVLTVVTFISLAATGFAEDHTNADLQSEHPHHLQHTQHSQHKDSTHKKSEHESHSEPEHQVEESIKVTPSAIESLSPDLREILSKEMLALQEGMKSIIPAYISANWQEIETTAMQMKNSYIMAQKLSKHQMHELHSKLPPMFIEQDQKFHYLAGMLAHAAEKKKPELVGFYFSQLAESCVNCHSKFATHKFPAFINGKVAKAHHH